MGEMGEHAWIISIIGDVLTLFGAAWTARAVFLTPAQAAGAAATTWDQNEQLKNALLKNHLGQRPPVGVETAEVYPLGGRERPTAFWWQ